MTETRNTAGNTGFASGGVTCKLGALCNYSSAVLAESFVLRIRHYAKPQNVCANLLFTNLKVFGIVPLLLKDTKNFNLGHFI